MTEAIWAIVNPAAAGGRAAHRWPALAARLQAAGVAYTPCVTCGAGDGARCARFALTSGATLLLVVGGDGTLNEVVEGCLGAGVALPAGLTPRLALWPLGTGTDFAQGLGIHDDATALATLLRGRPQAIDAGLTRFYDEQGVGRTRHFINVADLGLGPETSLRVAATATASPRLLGPAIYFAGALRGIAAYRPTEIALTIDGTPVYTGAAGLLAVANGRRFGGGMLIAPRARPNDGLFDVVLLEHVPRRTLATVLLPRVYRGTHLRQRAVHLYRGATVRIEAAGRFLLEVDGEVVGQAPATLSVLPGALEVLVPPDSPALTSRPAR